MIFRILRKIFSDEDFEKLEENKRYYKHNYVTITDLYNNLVNNNDELENEFTVLQDDYYRLAEELEIVEKLLHDAKNPRTDLENYWNNKYPSSTVTYRCQHTPNKGVYDLDVRWFFGNTNVAEIQNVVKDWHNLSCDDKMLKCQKWVKDNITYKSDPVNYGLNEYWGDAVETLKFRTGDCDNGAILMANLALGCGVPYWRVRLTAGGVNNAHGDFMGYHAFLTYLPDSELSKPVDEQNWVVCDWCYFTDVRPFNERPNYKDNILYAGSIWFSFNKKYAFSNRSTRLKF